jgi:hypothetical protein
LTELFVWAIHSQLISCTASEVAAMIEGAMHHRTEMDVECQRQPKTGSGTHSVTRRSRSADVGGVSRNMVKRAAILD